MEHAVAQCRDEVARLIGTDPSALSASELRTCLTGAQELLDSLTVWQARLMHEADRSRFWVGTGAKNMADWVTRSTKCSYGEASGKARLGAALEASPHLSHAVNAGEVSAGTATAVASTVVGAEAGQDIASLIDDIRHTTPAEAKKLAEAWQDANRTVDPNEHAARCHAKRRFTFSRPEDGMIRGSWALPTLEARTVINALSHLGGKPSETDGRTGEQRLADGLMLLADAYNKGTINGGHERPTILVTISAEALAGLTDDPGVTDNGDSIPASTVRHLAEDAYIQRITHVDGRVIGLGSANRWATEAQYRAVFARDGGCRWPGCTIPARWCDVDHLVPAAQGGATHTDNLVLWCRSHHLEKHRPWVSVLGDANHLTLNVNGELLACPPRGIKTSAAA